MKNLAEFKRMLTIGTFIKVTHYKWDEQGNPTAEEKNARPVNVIQSNCFALATDYRGTIRGSYCEFGKASNWVFHENTATKYYNDRPALKFEFMLPEQPKPEPVRDETKAPLCRCNDCDNILIDRNPLPDATRYPIKPEYKQMKTIEQESKTEPGMLFYTTVCPNCLTDANLMDIGDYL